MSETTYNGPAWLKPTGTQNTSLAGTPVSTQTGISPQYTAIVEQLRSMPKANRVSVATRLKKLGYKIPTSGQITPDFVAAVWEVGAEKPQWEAISGAMTDEAYLDARIAAQESGGGGGTGGPRTVVSTNISGAGEAESSIRDQMAAQLGRYPTEAEVRQYTAQLQSAQRKNPTRTSYNADGTVITTSGGFDEDQFFIDKFAGTDEAKRNRALQAYTYILQSVFGAGN